MVVISRTSPLAWAEVSKSASLEGDVTMLTIDVYSGSVNDDGRRRRHGWYGWHGWNGWNGRHGRNGWYGRNGGHGRYGWNGWYGRK